MPIQHWTRTPLHAHPCTSLSQQCEGEVVTLTPGFLSSPRIPPVVYHAFFSYVWLSSCRSLEKGPLVSRLSGLLQERALAGFPGEEGDLPSLFVSLDLSRSCFSLTESQANTQRSGKRPFGVGLLAAGYDEAGPHLFETCPSGNYFESYVSLLT